MSNGCQTILSLHELLLQTLGNSAMCAIHVAASSIQLSDATPQASLKSSTQTGNLFTQLSKSQAVQSQLENLRTYMEMQSARITISCLGLGFLVGVGVGVRRFPYGGLFTSCAAPSLGHALRATAIHRHLSAFQSKLALLCHCAALQRHEGPWTKGPANLHPLLGTGL